MADLPTPPKIQGMYTPDPELFLKAVESGQRNARENAATNFNYGEQAQRAREAKIAEDEFTLYQKMRNEIAYGELERENQASKQSIASRQLSTALNEMNNPNSDMGSILAHSILLEEKSKKENLELEVLLNRQKLIEADNKRKRERLELESREAKIAEEASGIDAINELNGSLSNIDKSKKDQIKDFGTVLGKLNHSQVYSQLPYIQNALDEISSNGSDPDEEDIRMLEQYQNRVKTSAKMALFKIRRDNPNMSLDEFAAQAYGILSNDELENLYKIKNAGAIEQTKLRGEQALTKNRNKDAVSVAEKKIKMSDNPALSKFERQKLLQEAADILKSVEKESSSAVNALPTPSASSTSTRNANTVFSGTTAKTAPTPTPTPVSTPNK